MSGIRKTFPFGPHGNQPKPDYPSEVDAHLFFVAERIPAKTLAALECTREEAPEVYEGAILEIPDCTIDAVWDVWKNEVESGICISSITCADTRGDWHDVPISALADDPRNGKRVCDAVVSYYEDKGIEVFA